MTVLGLTSKCSATSRREAPDLTASIARCRKSAEYGLGIEFPPRIKPLSGESLITRSLRIPSDSTTLGYALALALCLFVVVELALGAFDGALKDVDGRPEQIVEIRFEPSVAERRDLGVDDIGDRAGDRAGFGRPLIRFVVGGMVAVELKRKRSV